MTHLDFMARVMDRVDRLPRISLDDVSKERLARLLAEVKETRSVKVAEAAIARMIAETFVRRIIETAMELDREEKS